MAASRFDYRNFVMNILTLRTPYFGEYGDLKVREREGLTEKAEHELHKLTRIFFWFIRKIGEIRVKALDLARL